MNLGLIHGLWSLLILVIFVAIVAYVWRRDKRGHYEKAANIPFDHDDEEKDRRAGSDNNNV